MEAIYRKAGAADEQISKLKDISVRILEARQKRDFDMVEELKKERASLLTAEQKRKIVEMIRAHNEAMAEETTSTADSDTTVSEDPATTVTS
jgi:acetoin utilization deacetylase AcuC-like enzyme